MSQEIARVIMTMRSQHASLASHSLRIDALMSSLIPTLSKADSWDSQKPTNLNRWGRSTLLVRVRFRLTRRAMATIAKLHAVTALGPLNGSFQNRKGIPAVAGTAKAVGLPQDRLKALPQKASVASTKSRKPGPTAPARGPALIPALAAVPLLGR
jgi:hypothetical protein